MIFAERPSATRCARAVKCRAGSKLTRTQSDLFSSTSLLLAECEALLYVVKEVAECSYNIYGIQLITCRSRILSLSLECCQDHPEHPTLTGTFLHKHWHKALSHMALGTGQYSDRLSQDAMCPSGPSTLSYRTLYIAHHYYKTSEAPAYSCSRREPRYDIMVD